MTKLPRSRLLVIMCVCISLMARSVCYVLLVLLSRSLQVEQSATRADRILKRRTELALGYFVDFYSHNLMRLTIILRHIV